MRFGIEVDLDRFYMPKITNLINNIVERLQNFKKQKYNMLESIWEYVENKSRCRRQFLLDYFQDEASFGEEGCKFCDIEGISQTKAFMANRSLKIEKLYRKTQSFLESDDFNYPQVKKHLDEIYEVGEQEGVKVRAMKHLEDYTDHVVALYYRTIITLQQDQADAYARNQANDLIALLLRRSQPDTYVSVINDFIDIDEELVMLTLLNNEKLVADQRVAQALIDGLKPTAVKEFVSKLYIDNKLLNLNNTLIRSVQHGFIKS